MNANQIADDVLSRTGGYILATPLDVPGLMSAYAEMLARVQALPFVPRSWTTDVQGAMAAAGGNLWQPRYALNADAWRRGVLNGPIYPGTPSWLTGDAAVAWNTLTDWWKERMQPILAGWARDGAALVQAAAGEAKFWDTLYNVTKPIAAVGDVLLAAPKAVAGVAADVITGSIGKLLPVIAIVVVVAVALVMFKNKMGKG